MHKICRKEENKMATESFCISRTREIWAAGFPSLGGGFDSRIPLYPLKQRKPRYTLRSRSQGIILNLSARNKFKLKICRKFATLHQDCRKFAA